MTYASSPPYTLRAKASQIRERIAFVVENLTPELAEDVTFKRLVKWPAKTNSSASYDRGEPGWQSLETTTSEARWRMFYVKCSAWSRGDNTDNHDTINQALRLELLVGVAEESIFKFNADDPSTVYDTEDIIAHDEELLIDEIQNGGIFGEYGGEAAIGNVDNIEFVSCSRSPRVMTMVFVVRYARVRG